MVVPYVWSSAVPVLLANGNGSFQPAQSFAAGGDPSFVAVGDVNGDGRPDLAVANPGATTVSVLLGNGHGTFQPALHFALGTAPDSVAVSDVNEDGRAVRTARNGVSCDGSVLRARLRGSV